MTNYKITDLKPGTYFSQNLYLDKTFILSTPSTPITEATLKILKNWNFDQVESEGMMGRSPFSTPKSIPVEPVKKAAPETVIHQPASEGDAGVKAAIANGRQEIAASDTEEVRMKVAQNVYNEYCRFVNQIFTHYATHKELSYGEISSTVNILCSFLKENKNHFLRITPDMEARQKEVYELLRQIQIVYSRVLHQYQYLYDYPDKVHEFQYHRPLCRSCHQYVQHILQIMNHTNLAKLL